MKRFQDNLEAYRAGQYNETQVRREFIDPFLKALGWDVDNEQGYAEAYKDVVHEDAIRVGGAVKAPDYSCRIGGQRKFFVEAKKPAVNIKEDIHPAYQLRRYAWSAKLPLSILTDFEEFAVYDCRVKPEKTDKASAARLMYVRFTDYAEKWGEIAGIFSPEAIRKGSFDKFAHEKKGQRGTAEVDTAFLQEISTWRDELAANIALRNKERKLKSRDLSFAVQSTIDRLIFLRIAEDRGIEPYGRLRDLAAGKDVYARLADVFRLADAKYNSGLFHFQHEKGRDDSSLDSLTLSLAMDDKVLKGIIGRLYYPDSPYQFDVIPADILGQVYEQFLGKVIRLTVKGQAKVEEKPEVKKAGGVYYTPTYIVQYIVQQTVGKLVAQETELFQKAQFLTILDPACGSGSFLLGAYQFLLDWYVGQYNQQPEKWLKGKNPRIFDDGKGNLRLTIGERKRILLAHIYGVDIDPQAVEVTKLSLLLKVLEGETAQTLGAQMALLPERVLPDLSRNIQCGNSLIGPDFYDGQQLGLAGIADEEEFYRINAFDWQAAFPQVMGRGGFDVVIGNPPYIRIQALKEWAPKEVEFYKKQYVAASKGNYDIYVVFVEKGLSLLNEKGVLGYILPHKFFNAQYGEPLRELIATGQQLKEVVYFGDQQIFTNATTYTCLLFLSQNKSNEFFVSLVDNLDKWQFTGESLQAKVPISSVSKSEWNFIIGKSSKVFEKLSSITTKLGNVAEKIFQGLVTSADPIYLLDPLIVEKDGLILVKSKATEKEYLLETEIAKPLCKGSLDIRRYNVNPSKRVIFPYDPKISAITGRTTLRSVSDFKERFPQSWKYLLENAEALKNREKGKMQHEQWYGYVYPKSVSLFAHKKILTPSIAANASYALDGEGNYYFVGSGGGGGGGYGIILKDDSSFSYEFILGLLNSKVLDYYLKQISTTFRGGYFAYNRQYIEQLPICPIDFSSEKEKMLHNDISSLVTQILNLNQRLQEAHAAHEKTVLQRQIAATDRQIDQLVYQLYNLTPEEIALIEES